MSFCDLILARQAVSPHQSSLYSLSTPVHNTPTLPAASQPLLPHTAFRHASHLDSVPTQLMLFSRAAPEPGPNTSASTA